MKLTFLMCLVLDGINRVALARRQVAGAWKVVRRGSLMTWQGIGSNARGLRCALLRLEDAMDLLQHAWDACVSVFNAVRLLKRQRRQALV